MDSGWDTYQRAVGHELRALRRSRKLSLRNLLPLLPSDITPQTVAAYEQGVRNCSVTRFAEICRALGEPPHHVLARVEQRVHPTEPVHEDAGAVTINLAHVVAYSDPRLLPLRRWAGELLREDPERTHATLTPSALAALAELCDTTPEDVAALAYAAT